MYLGIDVGGTYTDGVLISDNNVLEKCKIHTKKDDLLKSVVETLDTLLKNNSKEQLKRVVVSTTLMTNLILENKYEPTGLLYLSGSGININELKLPFVYRITTGNVDFQGRIVEDIDEEDIKVKIKELIEESNIKNLGIISKFSSRNPELEIKTMNLIKKYYPNLNVLSSHSVSGQLNFIRRAMNTGLTLACQKTFNNFIASLKNAFETRKITCPVFILKADGGVVPLKSANEYAVDTILSGPAASSFGAKALLENDSTAVVIDIGGTTTDLSLILNSVPLFASKGVKIKDIYTHVRSLAVNSLPIGGDTSIKIDNGEVALTYTKEGLPACLGGKVATITDCLRILDLTNLGDKDKSLDAIKELANILGISSEEFANRTLKLVTSLIQNGIEEMYLSWQEEPQYRIWQLLDEKNIKPDKLMTIGGPSKPLGDLLAKNMNLKNIYYPLCSVANAIGAALALPNYEEYIRINTEKNELSTSWGSFKEIHVASKISEDEAKSIAVKSFKEYLKEYDLDNEPEIYQYEVFNMVRNWRTQGQIHEIKLGIPPQIIGTVANKEASI